MSWRTQSGTRPVTLASLLGFCQSRKLLVNVPPPPDVPQRGPRYPRDSTGEEVGTLFSEEEAPPLRTRLSAFLQPPFSLYPKVLLPCELPRLHPSSNRTCYLGLRTILTPYSPLRTYVFGSTFTLVRRLILLEIRLFANP